MLACTVLIIKDYYYNYNHHYFYYLGLHLFPASKMLTIPRSSSYNVVRFREKAKVIFLYWTLVQRKAIVGIEFSRNIQTVDFCFVLEFIGIKLDFVSRSDISHMFWGTEVNLFRFFWHHFARAPFPAWDKLWVSIGNF